MSVSADSRKQILERIRSATQSSAPAANTNGGTRQYQIRGKLTAAARKDLFVERLREYDAEVVECEPEELENAIAAQLEASGRRRFVAPPGLPAGWLVPAAWKITGFEWDIDHDLPAGEIEKAEGVLTGCFCGVAESGTIVLHHSAMEGRRIITLLPDWHLCIVRATQIVETLPEYFDRCENRGEGSKGTKVQGNAPIGEVPGLVTWISGPSATADIEMTRIKGVHGPRFLNVIVVNDGDQGSGAGG